MYRYLDTDYEEIADFTDIQILNLISGPSRDEMYTTHASLQTFELIRRAGP